MKLVTMGSFAVGLATWVRVSIDWASSVPSKP